MRTYSRALIFNAGRDVEYDLRNDLFAHLQKLPLAFYHTQRTGDLMSRVINDISAVRVMLGPGVLNFVNAPVYYVYAVALMLSMDVRMTLAALAPFPLLMYVARKFRGRIMKSSLEVQQQMSVLSSHVQENLSGMHVVKAYAQEDFQTQQFIALNKDYEVKSMEMAKMRGIVNPIMQGINGLTVLIVIWYGGVRVLRGDLWSPISSPLSPISTCSRGPRRLSAGCFLSSSAAAPPCAVSRKFSRPNRRSSAAPARDHGYSESKESNSAMSPLPTTRQRNGHGALEGVDFKLPVGRSVGLVGRIGSGKSTVAQLVPRLFDASSGAILMDGQDIRKLPLGNLRRMIGYVPQEPFLFSTSLKGNLAFGRDQCSSEELARAVRIAKLDRDLEIFPQGLDTVVGERGVTLSGGQKQRATLARALITDPPVLILDDCLSSVDAQTEAEILHGLRAILKEKTCLIISHRISAVKEADEILVLDDGKIIERGSHEELTRRGGVYAELYQQQRLSEELEQI